MKRKIEITAVEHVRIVTGCCPLCGWTPASTAERVSDEKVSLVLTGESVDIELSTENSNPKGAKTK